MGTKGLVPLGPGQDWRMGYWLTFLLLDIDLRQTIGLVNPDPMEASGGKGGESLEDSEAPEGRGKARGQRSGRG